MDVARDRQITPTLFDAVAPRTSADASDGLSFSDCFSDPGIPPAGKPLYASVDGGPSRDYSTPLPSHAEYSSSPAPSSSASAGADASTDDRQCPENASHASASEGSNTSRRRTDNDHAHREPRANSSPPQASESPSASTTSKGDVQDIPATENSADPGDEAKNDHDRQHEPGTVVIAVHQSMPSADGTLLPPMPSGNSGEEAQAKAQGEVVSSSTTAGSAQAIAMADPLVKTIVPEPSNATAATVDPAKAPTVAAIEATASDTALKVVTGPTEAEANVSSDPASPVIGDQVASQGAPVAASGVKMKSTPDKLMPSTADSSSKVDKSVDVIPAAAAETLKETSDEKSSADGQQHSQGERSLPDVENAKSVTPPPTDAPNPTAVATPDPNSIAPINDLTSSAVVASADSSGNTASPTSTDGIVGGAMSGSANSRLSPAILRKVGVSQTSEVRGSEIDPARFLHRVVKAFESAQQRDSEIRLRLHPAELGSLSIEVKVQAGVLTAHVQAETPEARTALLDNLPALRDRLAEQGIRIDKFDVDLMGHSDRQPQQSHADQHSNTPGRPTPARTVGGKSNTTELDVGGTPSVLGSASAGLNVLI